MPFLLFLKRWRSMIIASIGISLILILSLMAWRLHYLSNKAADQGILIDGYKTTISEITEASNRRDAVSREDLNDSLNNERSRTDVLGDIHDANDKTNCPVVLCDTIKRLLRDGEATSSH